MRPSAVDPGARSAPAPHAPPPAGQAPPPAAARERELPARLRRQAAVTVALYAAVAALWIAGSDRLLAALVSDPATLVQLSVVKGFAFVGVTAGLLYLLLRRTLGVVERAFSAVQKERRFAQSLVEAMPGVFYLYNHEGRFIRWNRNFERVSGYTREEMGQKNPLDFFSEAERGIVRSRIAEVFEAGESTVEADFISRDGTRTPYFFTGRRTRFDDQECLVGVGVDVTARRAAEEALRRSEERYRTTLDSTLEGCQLLDFDWRYLYLNPAAAVQNRRPIAELLGRRMPEAWPGIEQTRAFQLMSRCMKERAAVHEEVEFTFPDGVTGWFDLRVQPVPEGIFMLSIDVTERKRAERALTELNASLERKVEDRTHELEVALRRAEESDRVKSAFLATMSHELRTPLNSIIGFTGIVLQGMAGPLNAEQSKQLGMVKLSARHLLSLINDVLDISKIEAGQLEIRREPFDLGASVEKVTATVAPLAEAKGLSLQVVAPAAPLVMESDARRVEQILLNLLNNAVKFTERGSVTLTVSAAGGANEGGLPQGARWVRVTVADTGIGMRAEDLAKLFRPFSQIDSGIQRQHEGTGLGLAICHQLCQLLGGRISVESVWGRGSVFTVELPGAGGGQP